MSNNETDIIVTGERLPEDGFASSFSPYAFYSFDFVTQIRAPISGPMSSSFKAHASAFKIMTVQTSKGPLRFKVDATDMTDEQLGALAKMMQNFLKSPSNLQKAFEAVASHNGNYDKGITLIFRLSDKAMAFSNDSFSQRAFGDFEQGFTDGGVMPNGEYVVYMTINEKYGDKSIQDFTRIAAHELFHVYNGFGQLGYTERNLEHEADAFGERVISDIYKSNGSWVNDLNNYSLQTVAQGGAGDDSMQGTVAPDSLHGGDGSDAISGGGSSDFVSGGNGSDHIDGGDGGDWLDGGVGMDVLKGGLGANLMLGGLDADTYISTSGYGDKVVDHGGVDRLDLSYISIHEVVFGREYNDLVMNGGLQLRVGGHYNASGRVEQFTFAEGTYAASFIEYLVSGGSGPGEWTAKPVVLDLDGDGVKLTDVEHSRARFDVDGDGDVEKIGWMDAGDGMLVLDRDGDGRISGFAEISFVQDFLGADTDLEGLYAYDSDGDGFLTAADERFGEFQIWVDGNGNGHSEAKELFSLAELGIARLNLETLQRPAADSGRDAQIVGLSFFERADGTRGELADVAFRVEEGPDPRQPMPSTHEQLEPLATQFAVA
jgi:Ca2+-binding RTX toxin-like protein